MLTADEMYAAIYERVLARNERFEHIAVETPPKLTDIHETVYIGAFSYVLSSSRIRYIFPKGRRYVGGLMCTASDLARDYIAIKYPDKLKCTGAQYNEILQHRSHPLYAEVGTYRRVIYIDLKSAYWSIVKAVGWNVDYFPNHWLGIGASMEDFPFPDDKLARNCLVSAGLVTPKKIWYGKHQQLRSKNEGNSHPNYGLWACVQDTLHAIATEVLDVGGLYVHTDGYMCFAGNVGRVASVIGSWGFQASIKQEGAVEIYGAGAYRFAGQQKQTPVIYRKDYNNVERLGYHEWLKKRIAKAASMRLE